MPEEICFQNLCNCTLILYRTVGWSEFRIEHTLEVHQRSLVEAVKISSSIGIERSAGILRFCKILREELTLRTRTESGEEESCVRDQLCTRSLAGKVGVCVYVFVELVARCHYGACNKE